MKILPSNNGRRISLSCLDMTYYLPWNWHSHSPWKDESSFWDLAYFQGRTVSFRQCIHWFNQRYSVLPVLLFYILFGSFLLFLILRELGSSVPLLRKFPDVTSNSYGFKCEATFQKLFFFIWCIVAAFKHFPDFSTPTSFEITRISWLTSSLVFLTASRKPTVQVQSKSQETLCHHGLLRTERDIFGVQNQQIAIAGNLSIKKREMLTRNYI